MHTEALHRGRFSTTEYKTIITAEIFAADEHLELLEGAILVVQPQGPEHAGCTTVMVELLREAYGPGHVIREAKPLVVDGESLPEPDLVVLAGGPRDWMARHPRADEARLVVEASWTSQPVDRAKAAIYAKGGVAVYWHLDLAARRLYVHTKPRGDGRYELVHVLGDGDAVTPPGTVASLRVAALLP
jgi:Uma2 family endonuclease